MTTPRPDPRIGTDLGPYRIEAVIGRGGMGVVYRATDTRLDRSVALKILTPELADDETFRARFLRESRLAASIDDPNIIPIYEAGEVGGTYFLAMRFVDGTDLEARLGAGPLAPTTAVHLLGQVASALDAAHEAGLVHRDVKPANILIASGKGPDRPEHAYLSDFGLTKHRGSQSGATRAGSFLGTLDYIAPEQIEGKEVDGRADEYALACVAFQSLTGATPFPRDNDAATLMAHLRDAPPSAVALAPELPPTADTVLTRAMAKSPDDRYPTCGGFVRELREALGVRPTEERERPRMATQRRNALVAVGLAALAILLLAGGVAALLSGQGEPSGSPSLAPESQAAGATPSPGGSADSTAFPTTGEAALVAALDRADISTTGCKKGSYTSLGTFSFETFPSPIASVECTLDVTSGASSILVRGFGPVGTGEGFQTALSLEEFVGYVADRIGKAPPGDCATTSPAFGAWTSGDDAGGAIACYTDSASGDAIAYWTYEDPRVLVKAVNQRGDTDALRDFVQRAQRFLRP